MEATGECSVLDLQDPFVSWVDGGDVDQGVSVIWGGPRVVGTGTHYYKGTSLSNLQFAFSGPKMMKDVRLLQLPDGKIAMFPPAGESLCSRNTVVCQDWYDHR